MTHSVELARGQLVRLTTPYWDAKRGLYMVEYVYRNGSLGLVSQADGRRHDVPAYICRLVSVKVVADGGSS